MDGAKAFVTTAHLHDRNGGVFVMAGPFGIYPFLQKLVADGGCAGKTVQKGLAKSCSNVRIDIVKRPKIAQSCEVLPKRWIVERSIAWLNRCRRLAKDWESPSSRALACLRRASIRLMLRKRCNK